MLLQEALELDKAGWVEEGALFGNKILTYRWEGRVRLFLFFLTLDRMVFPKKADHIIQRYKNLWWFLVALRENLSYLAQSCQPQLSGPTFVLILLSYCQFLQCTKPCQGSEISCELCSLPVALPL